MELNPNHVFAGIAFVVALAGAVALAKGFLMELNNLNGMEGSGESGAEEDEWTT